MESKKSISFLQIILLLFLAFDANAQTSKLDSLKKIVATVQDDSTKIMTNYTLGDLMANDPDSSKFYFQKGLRIAKQIETPTLVHLGYNKLAEYWLMKGVIDSSSKYNEKALSINNSRTDLRTYSMITKGKIFFQVGKFEEAVNSYLPAIDSAQKSLDTVSLVVAQTNLGNVYRQLNKKEDALKYYLQSLVISESAGLNNYAASNLGNIGIVYRQKGDLEKALDYYNRSLTMHKKLKQNFHVAIDLMNIGVLYEAKEDYVNAKKHHLESNKISKRIQDNIGVVLTYVNLGTIAFKTNDKNTGLKYLDSSLVLSKKMNYKEGLKHSYLGLSEIYKRSGNYRKAYENRLKYEQWNDSLINANHLNAISELEIKFETQKKENEILKLSEQQLADQEIINKQLKNNRLLAASIVAIILIISLGFFIFKQRLENKKQQELILAISETQTEERKRIAQDIHDSIGGSVALAKNKIEMAIQHADSESKELNDALQTINTMGNEVRQISHNLMPGELVRFGLISAINTLIEQLNKESLNAQLFTAQMKERIEPFKEVQLYRVIQEAVQNVLKHAKAHNLFIQLNKHKNHLNVMIEDDGIGFVTPTNWGMGLKNIEQRVKMLNGIFTIDSTKNTGTTINIQIPV